MKNIQIALISIVGLALSVGVLYGVHLVGKTLSYSFFYEDMVERTVHKTVKLSCLKGKQ